MKRITERKAKETIDRYLEGSLTTDPGGFHIHQPWLFEYIYLIQEQIEGKEREILRTLASMIWCVMNEFDKVPFITRKMIDDAVSVKNERKREKSVTEVSTDNIYGEFYQYTLYSAFSTFIFSLFLTKKVSSFSDKERTLIGVLLSEVIMLIKLFDNNYPHKKLYHEFIKQSDEDFGRIAEIGRIIIQPLFDQFCKSSHFIQLTPGAKKGSLMILSRYTGLMRFIHETEPAAWEAEHLKIFLDQQRVEMNEEIFALQNEIFTSFFVFLHEKNLQKNAEDLMKVIS
jgi:hypothetical protein